MSSPPNLNGGFVPNTEESIYFAAASLSKNLGSSTIRPRSFISFSARSDMPRENSDSGTDSSSFSTEVKTFLPTSLPFISQDSNQEPFSGNQSSFPVLDTPAPEMMLFKFRSFENEPISLTEESMVFQTLERPFKSLVPPPVYAPYASSTFGFISLPKTD